MARVWSAAVAALAAATAMVAVASAPAAEAAVEVVGGESGMDLSRGRALQVVPAADCQSANVPQCKYIKGRSVVFLLDSSNSLDKNLMQTTGLDYIELLYCAFATQEQPQAALVSFASTVTVRVPLGSYTAPQWFAAIEAYRPNFALSCCTPTAEAFDMAQRIFAGSEAAAGRGEKPNAANIWVAFTVSDGVPYQNSNGPYAFNAQTRNAADYSLTIVPTEAAKLKNTGSQRAGGLGGVRLVFVGVRSGPVGNNRLPNINYFAGLPTNGAPYTSGWSCQTPAPTSQPSKTLSPVPFAACKQCFTYVQSPSKGPVSYCATMNPNDKSLWPIVSQPVSDNLVVVENFDLTSLIGDTINQLCSPPATQSPTSPQPTPTPTQAPIKLELNHLDLFLLLDRSYSIQTDAPACRKAPGSDASLPDSQVCWNLITGFAKGMVSKALALGTPSAMGWAGSTSSKLGLRVTVMGFACSHEQTVPLTFAFGENIVDQAGFDAAMAAADAQTPFGGTCPGAAAQRMLKDVQFSLNRPNKALVLITDGVTYDGNDLVVAAQGFNYFGVLTFSVGIGLPLSQYPGGLKVWQLKLQKKQLSNFVNGDKTRQFNLGAEGYSLLDTVSSQITDELPRRFLSAYTNKVLRYPYFCGGYSNQGACEDPSTSGAFCSWDFPKRKCLLKARCNRPKFACGVPSFLGITDPCCVWQAGPATCAASPNAPDYCGRSGNTKAPKTKAPASG